MRKILLLCLFLLFLTHTAATDFGDFSGDSDYGGGWDSGWSSSSSSDWSSSYSSSSSHSSSGYSSSSSSSGYSGSSGSHSSSGYSSSGYSGSSSSHSSSSYSGSSGSSSGSSSGGSSGSSGNSGSSGKSGSSKSGYSDNVYIIESILTCVVFVAVLFGSFALGSSFDSDIMDDQEASDDPPGAERTDPSTLRPISDYCSVDPDFLTWAFKQRLSNIYIELQHAWQAKDLEPVRPYLTDALFQQYDLQLNNYRRTGTTNVMEQVAVQGITLIGWMQQGNEDVIIARLQARLIDYVVNDATGELVRGSRTAEKYMTYEYSMSRRTGAKTASTDGMRTVNCPNCGSALDINQSAVCPYCGSTVQAQAANWVISGIKGLSQRTVEK